jgi:hypothetical protein
MANRRARRSARVDSTGGGEFDNSRSSPESFWSTGEELRGCGGCGGGDADGERREGGEILYERNERPSDVGARRDEEERRTTLTRLPLSLNPELNPVWHRHLDRLAV